MSKLKELQATPCPELKPQVTGPLLIANLSQYSNISNLKADNWVYGNQTEVDYYLHLFNKTAGRNVTKCPIDAPFVMIDTTDCTACPSRTPYFDLEQEECVSCEGDTYYNNETHACEELVLDQ